MKSWIKFVFIFSLALNTLLITDFIVMSFKKGSYYKNLDSSVGAWGLSKKGAGKLLRHAIEEEPEIMNHLMQIRENRKKIKATLLLEPFDRNAAEQTFTDMRDQSVVTQQRLHNIFIRYLEVLPVSERQEMIQVFLFDHHDFKGRERRERSHYKKHDDDYDHDDDDYDDYDDDDYDDDD